MRFSVLPENLKEALTYIRERGHKPSRIEEDEHGLSVLIFPPPSDDRMFDLVQALPLHLSAKIGMMMGSAPPFRPGEGS